MIPVDRESETSVRQVAEDFGISWRRVAGSRQVPSFNQTTAAGLGCSVVLDEVNRAVPVIIRVREAVRVLHEGVVVGALEELLLERADVVKLG